YCGTPETRFLPSSSEQGSSWTATEQFLQTGTLRNISLKTAMGILEDGGTLRGPLYLWLREPHPSQARQRKQQRATEPEHVRLLKPQCRERRLAKTDPMPPLPARPS